MKDVCYLTMLSLYSVAQKALATVGNMLIEIYWHNTFYIYYLNVHVIDKY